MSRRSKQPGWQPEYFRYKWEDLAQYNAECARGIVHTAEYDARMAEQQAEFDAEMAPSSGRQLQ